MKKLVFAASVIGLSYLSGSASLGWAAPLVSNGDFETVPYTNQWTVSGGGFLDQNTVNPNPNIGGSYSIQAGANGVQGGDVFSYIAQNIATIAGATYEIHIWVDNASGQSSTLTISWGGNDITDTFFPLDVTVTDWTEYVTDPVTASGGTTELKIGSKNAANYFYFDDISIVQLSSPAPEPGSLALLALGLAGAGFARRRRNNL